MVTLSARTGMREILEQNGGTTYQGTRRGDQATSSDQAASKLQFNTVRTTSALCLLFHES